MEELKKILDTSKFSQVGYVVNNLEESIEKYEKLFGCKPVKVKENSGPYEITKTTVFGEPAPKADCRMAFFDLVNGVQIELIEPNQEPSAWRNGLNEDGEGIHHLAFNVDDAEEVANRLVSEMGGVIEQVGNYGNGSGRYIYVAVKNTLKCRIELLESFE